MGTFQSSTPQHPHGLPSRDCVPSPGVAIPDESDWTPVTVHGGPRAACRRLLSNSTRTASGPAYSDARKQRRLKPPLRAGSPGGARCRDLVRVTWRGRGLGGCSGRATEYPGSAGTRGDIWRGRGGEGLAPVRPGAGSVRPGPARAVSCAAERSAGPPSPRAGCEPESAWGGGRGRDAAPERRTPGAWSPEWMVV